MRKFILWATLPMIALYGCCGNSTSKEVAAFETISKDIGKERLGYYGLQIDITGSYSFFN